MLVHPGGTEDTEKIIPVIVFLRVLRASVVNMTLIGV
jgi:hypothetical protein